MTSGDSSLSGPHDTAARRLVDAALADLRRGEWRPDAAALEAAMASACDPRIRARLANLLTHHHFTQADMTAALASCHRWLDFAPGDTSAKDSLLSILLRLGRYPEAIAEARGRLGGEPENHRLQSSLCNALSRSGDEAEARSHGAACLEIQDRLNAGGGAAPAAGPPRFDPAARERNIIAFSLYGAKPHYAEGAIRNVLAAHFLYPEWTCRFYIDDSVPRQVTARLAEQGAQLRTVTGLPRARFGTFWRFLVADDPGVDRFLLRDCDACLNLRERAAVEDWLESARHFHVMRDGFTHTDLMLAGMWGGVRGVLPPMLAAMVDYCEAAPFARTADQAFLRERAWPHVRLSVLMHDACFAMPGAIDFPPRAQVPGPRVGQAVGMPRVEMPGAG